MRGVKLGYRKIQKFLDTLSSTGSVTSAAKAAGASRNAFYDLRRSDPQFRDAWHRAREQGLDALEDRLMRRQPFAAPQWWVRRGRARPSTRRRQPFAAPQWWAIPSSQRARAHCLPGSEITSHCINPLLGVINQDFDHDGPPAPGERQIHILAGGSFKLLVGSQVGLGGYVIAGGDTDDSTVPGGVARISKCLTLRGSGRVACPQIKAYSSSFHRDCEPMRNRATLSCHGFQRSMAHALRRAYSRRRQNRDVPRRPSPTPLPRSSWG